MYRIMIAESKRANYETLYRYMTTTVDGVTSPLEIETKEALDVKVQKMLNDDGYAKDDFIIVQVIDYTLDAMDYSDDEKTDTGTSDNTENAGSETSE